MLNLTTPIEKLPRVGPKFLPRLKKLGIRTIRDLLWHFPARYEDYSKVIPISEVSGAGSTVSIHGTVTAISTSQAWRRRMTVTTAAIEDNDGIINAVWFNQPYIERSLPEGAAVSLAGKVSQNKRGLYLSNPSYEKISASPTHTGRLVPIYPETEGITSKYLRFLIKPLLAQVKSLADPLPPELIKKYGFPRLSESLHKIHFPSARETVDAASRRFAFEELLVFQLRILRDHRQLQAHKAPKINFDKNIVSDFVKTLPFTLTDDQRISAYEILQDMEKPYPMNRLLNGDVGSGKTVVALIAAYQAVREGCQVAFMAPTEILAMQHFKTITLLLGGNPSIKTGLLTGTDARQSPIDETEEEKISKKLMAKKIADGQINIVVGTHAVIQKNIKFKKLGLVVIDEQHRFGVEQRMKLIKDSGDLVPHLLSMTATPIPRTLALTIYGDLDVSLLKMKPSGRRKIISKVIKHNQRLDAYKFIDGQIADGRQVFVICPRIEAAGNNTGEAAARLLNSKIASMWADVKAVTEEYEKLSKQIFPHRRVAMLHGQLKPTEKVSLMRNFKDGHYDILVSTSVVEVGVDIPNATIMMIESAERFGLAQLHQFRGRVGRSIHQSYCLLFTTSDSTNVGRRLRALEKTDNGFELAEMDLKIRGPGEFTGIKQSGIPDIAMASLADIDLIKKARLEAKLLLKEDPTLNNYPLLKARLTEIQQSVHFE